MARQKAISKINPDVLKWIIDSSGWETSDLAEKLEVKPELILKWKTKKQPIDIQQLEKLADCVKRPLAIFFLPKPPSEHVLKDFRKIAGSSSKKLCKETLLTIRGFRYLQSVAQELLKQQKNNLIPKIETVSMQDDPDKIAIRERKNLGFDSPTELLSPEAKGSINNRYNKLREILESLNIFVFQAGMPVEEVRGLTLSKSLPQVIVINSNDSHKARIFSLMHEFAHILLEQYGICIPEYGLVKSNSVNNQQRIELWCNKFAAAILVPQDIFLEEFLKLDKKYQGSEIIIDNLSKQFRVSKQVIIVRILKLFPDHPGKQNYQKMFNMLRESRRAQKGGFAHPVDLLFSRKGKKYISLVLDSRKKDIINNRNTIDYLDLKLKHLKAVQERL